MSVAQMQSVDDRYQARFGNLDGIFHLSFATDPRFSGLLQGAMERGTPVTRHEIESAFGEIAWEE